MKIRLLTSVAFFWLLANNQHYVENELRLVELAEKAAADLELRIDALRKEYQRQYSNLILQSESLGPMHENRCLGMVPPVRDAEFDRVRQDYIESNRRLHYLRTDLYSAEGKLEDWTLEKGSATN